MNVLFDQGVPVPLRRQLPGHRIDTLFERGWSSLANGELLDAGEADGYEVLVRISPAGGSGSSYCCLPPGPGYDTGSRR